MTHWELSRCMYLHYCGTAGSHGGVSQEGSMLLMKSNETWSDNTLVEV